MPRLLLVLGLLLAGCQAASASPPFPLSLLLGAEVSDSVQWSFSRVACADRPSKPGSNVIDVILPDHAPLCLALGS